MKIVLILVPTCLLAFCTAEVRRAIREPQYLESHQGYPYQPYLPDTDEQWTIIADEGDVIGLQTVGQFSLEDDRDCDYDQLVIVCGENGEDGQIARVCGSSGITSMRYSSGNTVVVKFETDNSIQATGFRLMFQAFEYDPARNNDCHDSSEESEEEDEEENSGAAIAGIVVGIILFIIFIVVVVAVCVCCGIAAATPFYSRRHTPTGAPYVQNYPMQAYPATYPQPVTMGAAAPPGMQNQAMPGGNTGPQPTAGYLPPTTPMAVNQAQAPPPAQPMAPPTYDSVVPDHKNTSPPAYDNNAYI